MYFQSEKIFSDENIILGLTFQPMLDLVVIAEIAEIDSTIEMTTVIIIDMTMVKIVLKVIGDQDQHLHSETMIVIAEIDTIPLGIAEASAIVADTTVSVDKNVFKK